MPRFLTTSEMKFPSVEHTDEHGIIAVGGDLSVKRLLSAYKAGIFPWPHEGLPLLWFCPDPRFVLEPSRLVVSQSLKKTMRQTTFTVHADRDFLSVITKCKESNRAYQAGTWITDEMIDAYHELHKQGFAHSVEAYDNDVLVGGLYGVSIGTIFFGESMFFEKDNASKICFATLVAHLCEWDFSLVDCQAHTNHLERFGAHPVSRSEFLKVIAANNQQATKRGLWHFHLSPHEAISAIKKPPTKHL